MKYLFPLLLVPVLAVGQTRTGTITIIDDDTPPAPQDELIFQDVFSTVIDSGGLTTQRFAIADCDFNRDGYRDLVIGDHAYPSGVQRDIQIYQGDAQLTFNRLLVGGHQSDTSSLRRITSGHSCVDINGDGWQDLYGPDADGGDAGRLTNTTPTSGVAITFTGRTVGCKGGKNRCWSFDFDGDGDLDRVEDALVTPTRSRRILDWATETELLGDDTAKSDDNAIVADFDGDGWADILYPRPGIMYWNDGGSLTKATSFSINTSLTTSTFNARNFAVGDFDRDGDVDLILRLVDNTFSNTPTWLFVYRNNGGRSGFTDVAATSGIPLGNQQGGTQTSIQGTGAYANLFAGDFNLDGCTDVLVPVERLTTDTGNRHALWIADCDMTFTRNNEALDGILMPDDSGKTYIKGVDWDWDGDLDVVGTAPSTANIMIRRNVTNYSNRHSLNVRVKGPSGNVDSLHAILNVWDTGRSFRVSTVQIQEGMQGQLYPTVGLGANTQVDIFVQCPPRSGSIGPTGWLDNIGSNQNIVIDCSGSTPSWGVYVPGNNW